MTQNQTQLLLEICRSIDKGDFHPKDKEQLLKTLSELAKTLCKGDKKC